MPQTQTSYDFDELKSQVRSLGLLKRVPLRGSIEMVAILLSMGLVYVILFYYNHLIESSSIAAIGLGLFMALVFTRAVFCFARYFTYTVFQKQASLF
ncbi:hypothetical protein [Sulfurimonas sediminis]|uniref:hypothetical protein n=1 Tax=Sulfurimonas sediminis TaxID=2590020 RepID=UPI0018671F67|nr:hypothetical protein [Sulfurimonas sediminis]